jgi:AhpD family alkylhydroperoxidase
MKDYLTYHQNLQTHLANLHYAVPDTMTAFSHLSKAALKSGQLSSKVKELIALGIAIVMRCDGCIAYQVHDALDAGAEREEILEAIGVAVLMGVALRSFMAPRHWQPSSNSRHLPTMRQTPKRL